MSLFGSNELDSVVPETRCRSIGCIVTNLCVTVSSSRDAEMRIAEMGDVMMCATQQSLGLIMVRADGMLKWA